MGRIRTRLMHAAWNVFDNRSEDEVLIHPFGASTGYGPRPPSRSNLRVTNERSIIASVYTRLSIDVASVDIRHVRLDEQRRYSGDIDSGLNNCLSIEANTDQGARHFIQDVANSLFTNGVVALVPIEFTANPGETGGWDIRTMRTGVITKWWPKHVTVEVYNERRGMREPLTLPKSQVAIVENPLYDVMNEPNSTLQRLIRVLRLLDSSNDLAASGKLDLLIQLPYTVKREAQRVAADQRRRDMEEQLSGSQYGVAYVDGTEKVIQLNRGVENNLLKQATTLWDRLYSELGLTPQVMNGTADEAAMLNYINRVIEPILGAIAEAMQRTFLTKTARSQGQAIMYFRDPFKLVPMKDLAEMADKFTRNEIVTKNEFRGFIGLRPSDDPRADQLRNSNMPQSELGMDGTPTTEDPSATPSTDDGTTGALDDVAAAVDGIFNEIGESLDAP